MGQLPEEKLDELLKKFLFKRFIKFYMRSFETYKVDADNIKFARYKWDQHFIDPEFRNFMCNLIFKLEPIKFSKDTILADELDEINQVIYLIDEYYHVGFSINRQPFFRLKMKNKDIGAYYLTFDKQSSFIYKTIRDCWGYFIRRKSWKEIISNEET